MRNVGMSKHDITSFDESEAINFLEKTLESKHTIKTFFSANDRTPNHDGFFELVNEEHTPKKQFIVQIKKVDNLTPNTEGKNAGKYVYNLRTNFLYYVKEKVTESPAIYFVVDIKAKRIFWIYLSDEFLMNLDFENHETVSYAFGDAQILRDINHFTTQLHIISNKRNSLFCYKSREEITELQNALDYINHLFDYDFCKIKDSLYPNLWRFGIRSSVAPISIGVNGNMGNPQESLMLALYPQIKGTIDTGIQEFNFENANLFNNIYIGSRIDPMEYAKETVHKALKVFFEKGIPNVYLPNIVLQEKIWRFIEKTNRFFSESDDISEISMKETELRVQLILRYIDKILTSDDLCEPEVCFKELLTTRFANRRHSIDISSILSYVTKEPFINYCRNEKEKPFSLHNFILGIIDEGSIEVLSTIDEIKRRNIVVITPIWKYDLFTLRKMDEDCFTACINEITSKWLTNLPSLYEETYNKLIETSKYKYNGKIVFKNYYSNPEYGISRFGTIIHKYNNESFSICQDSELSSEFTEELRQKGLTYISNGFSLDSFIDQKMLYNESLNCLIYKGICEMLGFKAEPLHIGSKSFSIGQSLF